MNQWDELMVLMAERKEMIEKLLAICHDLLEQNMRLKVENFVLRQQFSIKQPGASTKRNLKIHEACEAGGDSHLPDKLTRRRSVMFTRPR
jgi:regulator of replication initiation timing